MSFYYFITVSPRSYSQFVLSVESTNCESTNTVCDCRFNSSTSLLMYNSGENTVRVFQRDVLSACLQTSMERSSAIPTLFKKGTISQMPSQFAAVGEITI